MQNGDWEGGKGGARVWHGQLVFETGGPESVVVNVAVDDEFWIITVNDC